jgi:hypothetical protein
MGGRLGGVMLVAVLFVVSCTSHRILRPVAEPVATTVDQLRADEAHRDYVSRHSVERYEPLQGHQPYSVSIVEFDDQGWLWNPRQVSAMRALIEQQAEGRGALVVVFLHGWKNNAEVCNRNLVCFRDALQLLADLEARSARSRSVAPRAIVGIYPAWRGLSLRLAKNFSFWGRKETAHRVGRGTAVDVIAELAEIQQRLNQIHSAAPTRLIYIGHSFGAAILYEAVAGIVRTRVVDALAPGRRVPAASGGTDSAVRGIGDLVVLVNPAFEASLYHDIDVRTHWASDYSCRQTPVMMTVSSKGDWATRSFFPIGRWFSTIAQKARGRDQRAAMAQTIGNYEPFRTHTLSLADASQRDVQRMRPRPMTCECPVRLEETALPELRIDTPDPCDIHLAASRRLGVTQLTANREIHGDNPFMVVRADTEVVSDHTGIFTAPFFEFLVRYVSLIDTKKRLLAGTPAARESGRRLDRHPQSIQ